MEHLFFNKERDSKENEFVINISDITSKESIIEAYAQQMHCSYFGKNWDALSECVSDFSWISQDYIVIIHSSMERLKKDVKNIYLEIIFDSIMFLDSLLKEGKKVKHVDFVFDKRDKDYIEKYYFSYVSGKNTGTFLKNKSL